MDPNETYSEIRQLVKNYNAGYSIDEDRLDALISSLSTWINDGGFKPNNYSDSVMLDAEDIVNDFS